VGHLVSEKGGNSRHRTSGGNSGNSSISTAEKAERVQSARRGKKKGRFESTASIEKGKKLLQRSFIERHDCSSSGQRTANCGEGLICRKHSYLNKGRKNLHSLGLVGVFGKRNKRTIPTRTGRPPIEEVVVLLVKKCNLYFKGRGGGGGGCRTVRKIRQSKKTLDIPKNCT